MKTTQKEAFQYEERFLFRRRVHTLTSNGIRTQQYSFFNHSDITTDFEKLGPLVQYQSDLHLSEVIMASTFLILGIRGLTRSSRDEILFAISIILIAVAIYWIIGILFNLQYVGGFYFSNASLKKDKDSFEIKSRYPANEKLNAFLNQIRLRQQAIAFDELLTSINYASDLVQLENEANNLRKLFSIEIGAFDSLIKRIRIKFKGIAIDKFLTSISSYSKLEQLEREANNLKQLFSMGTDEFDSLTKRIRARQQEIAIDKLLNDIDYNSDFEQVERDAIKLKHRFSMSNDEFDSLIKRIRVIQEKIATNTYYSEPEWYAENYHKPISTKPNESIDKEE